MDLPVLTALSFTHYDTNHVRFLVSGMSRKIGCVLGKKGGVRAALFSLWIYIYLTQATFLVIFPEQYGDFRCQID